MKRISVLFCGGTVGMMRNKSGALTPTFSSKLLLEKIPDMNKIANVTVRQVVNVDSSNMTPKIWEDLAVTIQKLYNQFDGFVVIHGTDTMAFTASALSFAIQNLTKPIIFTGSQKPLSDIASDAPINIINALLVATKHVPDVCIVFGSRILRGVRSSKVSESHLNAFESPLFEKIGNITTEPHVHAVYAEKKKKKIQFQARFDPHVAVVDVIPGFNPEIFAILIDSSLHGIILRTFGPGNIPDSLISEIRRAKEKGFPILILSQSVYGMTQMHLYQVGYQALRAGAIPGRDMTMEAALTKFMWILAQTRDPVKIDKAFRTNFAGEVTLS
ncbi:asparaginase [Candidatus Gottesmanbacteria bacterium]|nr:asparaginase [Candidatus Gottesmanbacteria bacterium]